MVKTLDKSRVGDAIISNCEAMGRRQVVRHRVLVPTSRGSNPFAPVINITH
ncbi:hypothetical protein PLAN_70060 [Planktothrix rubescens CCAP 1459/22]|uniref:Uncharacterized protein n=1 Tax=Planktothrix rubescens CCAP 1459/22 TaxID=329571 RepID=A0A6J7ZSZ4_PLARU|nr:hypothetical protein PLAN_70060 [Planktothrix rubescens NIVA-CYA 18]CAD0230645.1 conserved hypothetical protein [Planktothrix agardhii]